MSWWQVLCYDDDGFGVVMVMGFLGLGLGFELWLFYFGLVCWFWVRFF